jgi:hypothetical protein
VNPGGHVAFATELDERASERRASAEAIRLVPTFVENREQHARQALRVPGAGIVERIDSGRHHARLDAVQ